jgi:hypothetical protein
VLQGRFFDCALRSVEEYSEEAEYDQPNSVTAGLVQRAEEPEWSRARLYWASGQGGERESHSGGRSCTRQLSGWQKKEREFEGKAADSLKNESLR